MDFIEEFAEGIGDRKPIVIYEPDGLPHTTAMSKYESEKRLDLMLSATYSASTQKQSSVST